MMWAMRSARFRPAVTSGNRRRRQRGQGMVEFALVAPVFFFVIFAMIDGGFLLFSVNAVDQATTVGSNSVAALGKLSTADTTSLTRMAASSSLGATSLISISEVDIEQLQTNTTGDGFNVHSDGTPAIQTGCSGGPSGVDGANECINRYTMTGFGTNPTIALIGGTAPWPPSARNVYNGQSDFVGLKVTYTYRFFTGISPVATLTTTKTFRLEPWNAPGT